MGRELLHIEPDAEIAESVRRAFAAAGVEVATLGAGEPAVDRCRANQPGVVLLSAELPDMSGFSVCNRLKRSIPGVPVILYTREDADAAVAAHRLTRTPADDYLRAPLDLGSVVARATELLAHAADAGGPASVEPVPSGDESTPAVRSLSRSAAVPPPIPGQPSSAEDLLPEWPSDGPAPHGDASEEVAFLRERVRAKDAFLARVKQAMAAQRAETSEVRERLEGVRRQALESERARLEAERLLGEARAALDEAETRRADLDRRLVESETTRQALSDVLTETMQHAENSEREWSERLAIAEDTRARAEAQTVLERSAAASALESERQARTALEEERASERERFETQLAQGREEREALARELARVQVQLEQHVAASEEQRNGAATAITIATEERDQARRRADAILADLREERGRVEQATAEIQARTSDIARLEGELGAARRHASELEAELAGRVRQATEVLAEAQALRASTAEVVAEAERRHVAEVARHKDSLIDIERRLEASARAEAQARRRVQELEKERAERTVQGDRLAALEHALARAREELQDLRTENDFLNGEVARYTQKNRELLAQLQRP